MTFTERELTLLSDGILTMIENAGQAKKLVCDTDTQKSIDRYVKELQALNSHLCSTPTADLTLNEVLSNVADELERTQGILRDSGNLSGDEPLNDYGVLYDDIEKDLERLRDYID